MNPNAPLLKVDDLSTSLFSQHGVVKAVAGLSLEIRRGETFALVGESGCGKSITALSIMRLLPEAGRITSGRVDLSGIDLLSLPESAMRDIRGRRMAMIFQEPGLSLNPVMRVEAQITETLKRHTALRGAKLQNRVLELLDAVGLPNPKQLSMAYAFELSGGMKQRVMIAIALACNPELLIADEPTTALDVTIQAQILELLRKLQRDSGMAILLITHDLGVVAEMAEYVAVMYAGQIIETAPVAQFFKRPAHPYSRKLFDSLPGRQRRGHALAVIPGNVPALTQEFSGCRYAPRCDYAWDRCHNTIPAWYLVGQTQGARCHLLDPKEQHHAGGSNASLTSDLVTRDSVPDVTQTSQLARARQDNSLLEVDNLSVHFPIRKGIFKRVAAYTKAVDGVSLTLAEGRTLGVVGESGCGKTTLGKALLRLIDPSNGRILFAGVDLATLTPAELRAKRRQIQIVFQDPYASLDPRMRVVDIIEEGMIALGIGRSRADRAKRIDALMLEVGLTPEMKSRYPHEFSGGQRQRIAIARALAVEPKLLVCDEPTSALDVSVQAQILNLLKALQMKTGLAYLFITHNISVVEFIADDIAVMYAGRIVETGSTEEVLNSPRHDYTRTLLAAVPVIEPRVRSTAA